MSWWEDPALSPVLAGGYLGLLVVMWALLVVGVPLYGARWRLSKPDKPVPETGPWLSICIPARNEAHNIHAAVEAALKVQWPNLEVIVVDDRSDDGTGDVARQAGNGDSRLRVIEGVEPPNGWAGKPWACSRAAGEARGAYLLFLDADVCIHPLAAQAMIDAMNSRKLAMLSAFGRWRLVSFWERAVVPCVGWLIRGTVNLDQVNDPGRPEAFANGQAILFARNAYDQIGGHESVRNQILEDVRIAEATKKQGVAIGMYMAPWLFDVRLYRSLTEIMQGYSKNLYEGMGRRPMLGFGAILFIWVGTIVPFVALLIGIYGRLSGWLIPGNMWLLSLAVVCGLQLVFRWRIERFDGRSGGIAWAHPLANLVLIAILLRSILVVQSSWKGRTFVDGRASSTR